MKILSELEKIEEQIQSNPLVVIYFTGSACGACEVIKQKIDHILESYEEVMGIEVNGASYLNITGHYQVYALPMILLFVEGKESMRVGRNIDLLDFEKRLVRYIELLKL